LEFVVVEGDFFEVALDRLVFEEFVEGNEALPVLLEQPSERPIDVEVLVAEDVGDEFAELLLA
jgi:hypothetical protein